MNKHLTREICEIKTKSFPELNDVIVRGFYVPDYQLLSQKKLGGIRFEGECNFLDERVVYAKGRGYLVLPKALSQSMYFTQRRGIIAHELSHIISGDSATEKEVEEEAIKRGYWNEILQVVRMLENNGLVPLTYTQSEMLEMPQK